jgi:CubicO group peptidase (beta-lactamase class C family)
MSDWERVCRAVADLELLWEPGIRTGYHVITYGWILGEVARRIGGQLSTFGSRPAAFGHPGAGGSIGFADPEYHFAFAIVKTRMVEALPSESAAYLVATETRRALGIPEQ